jgi:hypothetical protein
MKWLHVLSLDKGSSVPAAFVASSIEGIDAKRMVFAPAAAVPSAAAVAALGGDFVAPAEAESSSYEAVAIAAIVLAAVSMALSVAVVGHQLAQSRRAGSGGSAGGCMALPCASAPGYTAFDPLGKGEVLSSK